jgi:hypothetical protein
MSVVYKLHGMLAPIISDGDPVFTSKFWQSLFKLSGTDLKMSSSYHPQTDGQTKHVNQCLETYLRYFVHSCPKNGRTSWILLSFGTTLVFTPLWADLHSKHCMVVNRESWVLLLLVQRKASWKIDLLIELI